MAAYNVVRFRVKPGHDQEFLDAHEKAHRDWPGLLHANVIKIGEHGYCIIGEWSDMDALAKARPHMIETLNSFRQTLEDLGGGGSASPIRCRARWCWRSNSALFRRHFFVGSSAGLT